MKLYALYYAFPCDERGVKNKVVGRVEIDASQFITTRQVLTQEELYEIALTKIRKTVPSLARAPITFTASGIVEEVNHV